MIKVFEAFAGIGTQRMALRNLGIEHEVVAIAEIDKFAIASYEAIHGEVNNLGDISKIKTEDIADHDLFTYSFPCQDISIAGKQAGLKEGAGTRSGLLWECEKVIEGKRPKYLLMENVKNLVGKKFKADFDKWLERLEELGYTNYWQVLNAKDYGIPQNRERVFVVSIFGEHEPYVFPKPIKLEKRLKDVLEDEVDEKFYLSQEQVDRIKFSNFSQEKNCNGSKVIKVGNVNPSGNGMNGNAYSENGVAPTVTTNKGEGSKVLVNQYNGLQNKETPSVKRLGGIFDKENQTHQAGSIYDKEQLAPTIDTMQGGWRQPSVVIGSSRGRNPENPSDRTVGVKTEQRLEINKNATSNTVTSVQKDNLVVEPYRIRKLIPLECWRLMGCSDGDFHKAQKVNSNTQLYKQAGNAIVVDVLEAIFNKLFIDTVSTGNNGNTFF